MPMSFDAKNVDARGLPPDTSSQKDRSNEVLVALRQIIRATDLHSKQVYKASGLTVPQIVVLQAVSDLGEVTTGQISRRVNLSQATVTTIIDRMEKRGLVERYRSLTDRRIVHTRLTDHGLEVLRNAPALLHEQFVAAFADLAPSRQQDIISTLGQVAGMLGAGDLDAAPLLDTASPLNEA